MIDRFKKVDAWLFLPLVCLLVGVSFAQAAPEDPKTIDSSSKWVCHVKGSCGSTGICCTTPLKNHLKKMEGIESFNVDKKAGTVTLVVKQGQEVKVEDLKKALGGHYKILKIIKAEASK